MGHRILRYAGIGPRKTPHDQLEVMINIAQQLDQAGWLLSSGWGEGADQAFGQGSRIDSQTQWIPWGGYQGAGKEAPFQIVKVSPRLLDIAGKHHPYWGNMKPSTRTLMVRNVATLLGDELDQVVDMAVYWQSQEDESSNTSGTNHTRRIASTWGIPAFNIRLPKDQADLMDFVGRMESQRLAA